MFDNFCRITYYYTVVWNVFHNNASSANFYVIADTDFTQHASMASYGYVIADSRTSAFSAADCCTMKAAEVITDGFCVEHGGVRMSEPKPFANACCWRDEETAVTRAIPAYE